MASLRVKTVQKTPVGAAEVVTGLPEFYVGGSQPSLGDIDK